MEERKLNSWAEFDGTKASSFGNIWQQLVFGVVGNALSR